MELQIQQLIDLTEKGLTEMATQMGVSLPQLWEILIRQQYVEAAQAFLGFGICLMLWGFIYKKRESIKKWRKEDSDDYDGFDRTVSVVILVIIFLTFSIIAFIEITIGIGKIINPEYYAIEDITRFISNLTN